MHSADLLFRWIREGGEWHCLLLLFYLLTGVINFIFCSMIYSILWEDFKWIEKQFRVNAKMQL